MSNACQNSDVFYISNSKIPIPTLFLKGADDTLSSSIFLSYPRPYLKRQEYFIQKITIYLEDRGFLPRTLGVTDYDMDAPLAAIRRLMLESNGLIAIAFRRSLINDGVGKPGGDLGQSEYSISNQWLTSPYCQIEPAMAYQIGLPVLILREKGVIADGILEKGVLGVYMPEFDLDNNIDEYFESREWGNIINKWEGYVRMVLENKGRPQRLY